jgi:hypothetical protein
MRTSTHTHSHTYTPPYIHKITNGCHHIRSRIVPSPALLCLEHSAIWLGLDSHVCLVRAVHVPEISMELVMYMLRNSFGPGSTLVQAVSLLLCRHARTCLAGCWWALKTVSNLSAVCLQRAMLLVPAYNVTMLLVPFDILRSR